MKASFLAIALFGLLVVGSRDLQAQAYGPYYYGSYWEAQYQQYLQYQHYLSWQAYLDFLRQTDPYYELHVMHYQLYRPSHQPYPIYQPCCYAWGVTIPQGSIAVRPGPQPVIDPRAQAIVSTLPEAVGPLPRAVSPLPPATRKR